MLPRLLESGFSNAIAAAVIAAIVVLVTRMRAREPLVHSLWVLVLLKLVTPPILDVGITWPSFATVTSVPVIEPALPSVSDEIRSSRHPAAAGNSDRGRRLAPALNGLPRRSPVASSLSWSMCVALVWLSGSAWCLLVLVRRITQFQRLLGRTSLASRAIRQRVLALSRRVGLARSPRVRVTSGVVSPLVWCPLPFSSPMIVLPGRLVRELSDDEQSALLLHELAHLRRRDHWVRWLELVAAVCFWWNPVVWWARRELQRTGDLCCDGWVLSCAPEYARKYAQAIVRTIDFLAEAKPSLPPMASAVGQVELIERRIKMILHQRIERELSWQLRVVVVLTATIVLPLSSRLVADEERANASTQVHRESSADESSATTPAVDRNATSSTINIPRGGVLEIIVTAEGETWSTKSMARAAAKLEAYQKAQARRPREHSVLVTINVNNTVREFENVDQAQRVLKELAEIVGIAKRARIQLGDLDLAAAEPQPPSPNSLPQATFDQNARPRNARDGDDGFGIGGGLGGQGAGGHTLANQQLRPGLAGVRRGGAAAREAQIESLRQRLRQLLTPREQRQIASADVPATSKQDELGEATLYSRLVHRDYQKATFSFEFGVRDDPTYQYANDWDLQYGNGGEHFHVTMVSDDRSRIVDLGNMPWEQFPAPPPMLPAHPHPRRDFVPTHVGHIYLVHTVDRNSDLYAAFRVEAIDQQRGTCDITWRLVDQP